MRYPVVHSSTARFPSPIFLLTALGTLLLSVSLLFCARPPAAHAQEPATNLLPVALAPQDRSSPVELIALTLDGDLREASGHTLVSGTLNFKLHNTSVISDVEIPLGFPSWGGGANTFDPARFQSFSVSADSKTITLNRGAAELQIGGETKTVDWYTFTLKFAPDEKKIVSADFVQDLAADTLPRFAFGLMTSTGWKGNVGSVRLTLSLPAPTTAEQFIALDPEAPEFDGQRLTWRYVNLAPSADVGLTFIRDSVWRDLLTKRAATAQAPNDANAHAALGELYAQLAAFDSPRRDNFYALATAELEAATRIDPNHRAGRLALARLYESRAGPAAGPRDSNYVALAVEQWRVLNTAEARQQLAEDYFFLGVAAHSQRDFQPALGYFDEAAQLAPNGAGPLYTPERLASERRAVTIARARALAEQNDIAGALARIGTTLDLSPVPVEPAFVIRRGEVQTARGARDLRFIVGVYPGLSDAAQKTLDDIAAKINNPRRNLYGVVNDSNLANATVEASGSDYALRVQILFATDADLTAALQAVTAAFPDGDDWLLARAVLTPRALEFQTTDNLFTRVTRYAEDVDLAETRAPLETHAEALNRAAAETANAASDDDAGQLKRALVQDARAWYLNALAGGEITYRVTAHDGETQTWSVTMGETRPLEFTAQSLRVEWAIAGLAFVEVIVLGILVWRWTTHRMNRGLSRRARRGNLRGE